MSLSIRLLGAPSISIDGAPQPPPRGKKALGLLAYLILSGRPTTREQLAGLLFADADDPLGALRWNLAEVRRLLGRSEILTGDPLVLELPPDAFVDILAVGSGSWLEAVEVPGLERELLEGVRFSSSPAFETWLAAERRHLQAQAEAILHEAAHARLAEGRGDDGVALAARLVAMNPFDENHQELLIRSQAASGDRAGAMRQLTACVELFRRELGVEPGPAVYAAAEATGISATATAVTGRAAALAQLDAGEAAIGAGALEAGLECLRRALAEAHASGELEIKARALLALGSALTHAARGRDEEASAALHEAVAIAGRVERPDVAAAAHRELAWIEILRARFDRGLAQIDAAEQIEGPHYFHDAARGACAYQAGRYEHGLELFTAAAEGAERLGDRRGLALCLGELGAIHLLRDEVDAASSALERACVAARELAWNAYVPYPEALLGIVDVRRGDLDAARERLEHAFALGCQIRDCCWEGISAAGLALLDEAEGEIASAAERFDDVRRRSVREPDAWLWGHAFVLDLACAFGVRHGSPKVEGWCRDLETLGARTMMREFLARAYLYRAELGDGEALRAAELVADEVDNPALHRRLVTMRGTTAATLEPR